MECVDHIMVVEDTVHKQRFNPEEAEKLEKVMKKIEDEMGWGGFSRPLYIWNGQIIITGLV